MYVLCIKCIKGIKIKKINRYAAKDKDLKEIKTAFQFQNFKLNSCIHN